MDLVESLNLPLPEQQTRISEHSPLAEALEANPLIEVGFNACCCCGKDLTTKSKKSGSIIECKGCQRVKYCSTKCRTLDSTPMEEQDEGGEEDEYLPIQHGHSSIVCALLRLCNKDEAVEDKLFRKGGGSALLRDNDDNDASMDRVRSELESYPATLANVLLEDPCYERVFLSKKNNNKKSSKQLVIHVVGASLEAELWSNVSAAQEAYAEALESVTEQNKRLERIHLIFVGPDCPKQNMRQSQMMTSVGGSTKETIIDNDDDDRKPSKRKDATKNSRPATSKKLPRCELIIETIDADYNGVLSLPAPDVVVFFNPGFTCPDYTWDDALSAILPGTAFLVTTNTEMEGMADCQYLKERGFIASLPPSIAAIDDDDNSDDDDDEGTSSNLSFFGENPYSGSRVRQSGNMANDLFVKNRWIFGGIIEPPATSKPSNKVVVSSATQKRSTTEKDETEGHERKKRKRKSAGNTKKANPALI